MSTPAVHPISLFDEVKLQAQVLVPLLAVRRSRQDKADALVGQALREYVRALYQRIGEQKPGDAREKWEGVWDELRPRIGDAVEREFIRNDDDAREYNVTRCSYAEFFKALGEPELGAILLCDFDFYIAEVGAPAVELTRTQTIMKGAAYCDFRYRFRRGLSAPERVRFPEGLAAADQGGRTARHTRMKPWRLPPPAALSPTAEQLRHRFRYR